MFDPPRAKVLEAYRAQRHAWAENIGVFAGTGNSPEDRMADPQKLKEIIAAGRDLVRSGGVFIVGHLNRGALNTCDLKSLLDVAESRLSASPLPTPDSLDEKALFAMWDAQGDSTTKCSAMRAAYKALYDHLTKPKIVTAAVWHVEYTVISTSGHRSVGVNAIEKREHADESAATLRKHGAQCVRVTGPHAHEVPA